mgnify:CR=1 FL=1
MPSLLCSLIMGAVVYYIKWFRMAIWSTLIIQVCVGIVLYIGLVWIFKLESFRYLISTGRDIFNIRKKGIDVNHKM